MNLFLSTRDEFFLINLDLVMYLQADDHYTHVFYATGATFLVPFGLSKLEEMLSGLSTEQLFLRLGRKYIVGTRYLFHINTVKQSLLLTDAHGNSHSLHITKPMLRYLVTMLENAHAEIGGSQEDVDT